LKSQYFCLKMYKIQKIMFKMRVENIEILPVRKSVLYRTEKNKKEIIMQKFFKGRNLKDKTKGFVVGMLVMAMMLGMATFVAARSESIEASYNNIKIVIDNTLVEPKDGNGMTVEPFIYNGTTYLPVRAVGEAFSKEVNWDGATNTVYVGQWSNKPYRDVAVWNKPYLSVKDKNNFSASEKSGNDFLNLNPPARGQTHVVYAANGMTKEAKGTILINNSEGAEIRYRFYDENDNLLYTSPILTDATPRTDFKFNIGSILQIRIEVTATDGSQYSSPSTSIENFRLVSTDY